MARTASVYQLVLGCTCAEGTVPHPLPSSYFPQMVFEAIKALKERNGSSIQAIKKHITTTHPTLNFTPHQMRSALKKGVESGKFIKVSYILVFIRSVSNAGDKPCSDYRGQYGKLEPSKWKQSTVNSHRASSGTRSHIELYTGVLDYNRGGNFRVVRMWLSTYCWLKSLRPFIRGFSLLEQKHEVHRAHLTHHIPNLR